MNQFDSVDAVTDALHQDGYIASEDISTTVYLAVQLGKPVLVEGPPGVGKTELARALSRCLKKPLIHLQCYEGLDEAKALYEWKYSKQLLYTQVLKDQLGDILQGAKGLADSVARLHEFGDIFYSEEFLEPRPLLHALRAENGSVLLIDEVDKADEEFEALLLEMLADNQVSIPEIGTVRARSQPLVLLTSNASRDLSDALRRRCLHLHIAYPDNALENRIIQARLPDIDKTLREQLVAFVQQLRELELRKAPAVSETLDWARALVLLHAEKLEPDLVKRTLNVLIKHQQDMEWVLQERPGVLGGRG